MMFVFFRPMLVFAVARRASGGGHPHEPHGWALQEGFGTAEVRQTRRTECTGRVLAWRKRGKTPKFLAVPFTSFLLPREWLDVTFLLLEQWFCLSKE